MKHFNYLEIVSKLKSLLSIIGVAIAVTCCNSSGSSSNSNGSTLPTVNSDITIDNAGIVPVLGNSPTTSVIYVHNNSDTEIKGITYGTQNNATSKIENPLQKNHLDNSYTFVNKDSAKLCSTIPAKQSCPLGFTTPNISTQEAQGSMIITANYTNKVGISSTFSQTINYMKVDNSLKQGAILNSGIEISGFNNPTGYATLYMYGGGINQVYTVSSVISNNPGFKVVQGNITGRQIQSNYVQPIEISAPTNNHNTIIAKLTAKSSNIVTQEQYKSVAALSATPVANGAILTSGIVPLIDSSIASPAGKLLIVNAGNADATIDSIIYPTGVTAATLESDSCGTNLPSYATCSIYFNVSQGGNGSQNITVQYGSNSLSQNITWYNSKGSALLKMVANPHHIIFPAGIGESTIITITNIGGNNLSNVTIPLPITVGGSAIATESNLTCSAGGSNLPVGQSCSYTVFVNDTTSEESGIIIVGVGGTYNNGESSYSRILALPYTSTPNAAVLSISQPIPMTVVGDNSSTETQHIVVSNLGNIPTTSISANLVSSPSSMAIESNFCTGINLNANESCTLDIQLGPVASTTLESGVSQLEVIYSDNNLVVNESVYADVPYTIEANTESISITSLSATGAESGTGESTSPYIFSGANQAQKIITFTLTNNGTNQITLRGIINNNSPIAWEMYGNSTCDEGVSLANNESCTIIFNNVLGENNLEGLGSAYEENINVPTVVFSDDVATGTQFSMIPPLPTPLTGNTVYVTGTQATVSNILTIESAGTPNASVSITHYLANATNYESVTVITRLEDYFEGTPNMSSNCTENSSLGVITQTCTLIPDGSGVANESGTYLVNQQLIESSALLLTTLFSVAPHTQTTSMTPVSGQLLLTNSNNHFVYVLNKVSKSISEYVMSNDGSLSLLESISSYGYNYSRALAIHPSGQFIYSTGRGNYVAAAYESGSISAYSVESNGVLVFIESIHSIGLDPRSIVIHPNGKFAYVVDYESSIVSTYTIESNGVLTFNQSITAPIYNAILMTIDPSGKFAYVSSGRSSDTNFVVYNINESTGSLSEIESIYIGGGIASTTINSSSSLIYIYNDGLNRIQVYNMDPESGSVTLYSEFLSSDLLSELLLDLTGRFLYGTSPIDNDIYVYSVNYTTGTLALSYIIPSTGTQPNQIAIDSTGQFAYVTNLISGNILVYNINQATGNLIQNSIISTGDEPVAIVLK